MLNLPGGVALERAERRVHQPFAFSIEHPEKTLLFAAADKVTDSLMCTGC